MLSPPVDIDQSPVEIQTQEPPHAKEIYCSDPLESSRATVELKGGDRENWRPTWGK